MCHDSNAFLSAYLLLVQCHARQVLCLVSATAVLHVRLINTVLFQVSVKAGKPRAGRKGRAEATNRVYPTTFPLLTTLPVTFV